MTDSKPILFSGEMIRALLSGAKTQTRRIIKPQPYGDVRQSGMSNKTKECVVWEPKKDTAWFDWGGGFDPMIYLDGPYQPGMRLWVRETWCAVNDEPYGGEQWIDYRATPRYAESHPAGWDNDPDSPDALKWKPSIFMPKWASRLTLQVTSIKIERVNEISEEDAIAEGAQPAFELDIAGATGAFTYRAGFKQLWDSINGSKPGCAWHDNPWVWCVSFRRVTP